MYGDPSRQRQLRRRERRQQISSFQVVFVSILAIGLLLTINFSARIRRSQQIDDLRGNMQATITVLEGVRTDLRQERDYVASDDYIIAWSHREAKMIRPGERLVIPVPGLPPAPTAQPNTTPQPSENDEPDIPIWQLWWNLFFDSDPPG
ncbi:MAG: hypothetical protein HY862_12850 [Chloroflexi bacterium]|nr:hypothetical protein [Chloroflexota bacterium]